MKSQGVWIWILSGNPAVANRRHNGNGFYRVPTSSGNHGKPGKSQIKIPCMEKSWNLIKAKKSWKNHGIL